MDIATSKSLGMDTETSKSPGVDIVMARRGYSDASFLLHQILHQKVRNVENLRGKIHTFVLVEAHLTLRKERLLCYVMLSYLLQGDAIDSL